MVIRKRLPKLSEDEQAQYREIFSRLESLGQKDTPSPLNLDQLDPSSFDVPSDWHSIIRYLRTAPFVGYAGVVGAGLGCARRKGREDGEISAVVLVKKKLPRGKVPRGQLIPASVKYDGQVIPIDVQVGFDPTPGFAAGPALGAFPRATGSCSGASLATIGGANPCAGGTLTGIFGRRAFTCAHVALGFGFEEFLANLPVSLLWLLDSPSGTEMIAAGPIQVGQGLHQLFEVDTNWPILVPFPSPIAVAGVLGFVFVDGAAGDVQPIAIPPFVPPGSRIPGQPPFSFAPVAPLAAPPRSTRFGARIRSARIAWPGERCQKDGQTTGQTWGDVWLPFFQLYLPVPLPFAPTFVLFDTVLCRLVIAPGDSGAAVLSEDMHYLAQVSLGMPPPAGSVGGGPQPGITCPVDANDLLDFTLGTPYYYHELLLNLNLS